MAAARVAAFFGSSHSPAQQELGFGHLSILNSQFSIRPAARSRLENSLDARERHSVPTPDSRRSRFRRVALDGGDVAGKIPARPVSVGSRARQKRAGMNSRGGC